MTALVELAGFALYIVQLAGILMGVGAEMVLLVSYLLHLHTPSSTHDSYIRATRFVERMGLGSIVLSGLGVVLYHALLWQVSILFAPAFIAKWILIGAVLVGYRLEFHAETRAWAWGPVVHGFIGGSWLALFLLHMLAPDTTMLALFEGYAAWMAFFAVVWSGFVTAMSPKAMMTAFATPTQPPMTHVPILQSAKTSIALPNVSFSVSAIAIPQVSLPKLPELQKFSLPKLLTAALSKPQTAMFVAPKAPALTVYRKELPAPVPPQTHIEPAPAPRKSLVVAAAVPIPRPALVPTPIKPAAVPTPADSLPAIRVMPRSPEELNQN